MNDLIEKLLSASNLALEHLDSEANIGLYKEAARGPVSYALWQLAKRPGLWSWPALGAGAGAAYALLQGYLIPKWRREHGGYTTAQEETFETLQRLLLAGIPIGAVGGLGVGLYRHMVPHIWDPTENRFRTFKEISKSLKAQFGSGKPQQPSSAPVENAPVQQPTTPPGQTQTAPLQKPVKPRPRPSAFRRFYRFGGTPGAITGAAIGTIAVPLLARLLLGD